MHLSDHGPRRIRFGVFEVDLDAGELRKQGLRLKLVGQPFAVLARLLEQPGEIVTREEIQKTLWPGDTFVDFDHSVNTAVNKIRDVLGDDANNPRFVETVPRRGYRFIYPIAASSTPETVEGKSAAAPAVVERREQPRHKSHSWVGFGFVTVAMALVVVAIFIFQGSRGRKQQLKLTPFTTLPGVEAGANFSPDGNQIAFHWSGERHDNWDIYVKVIGSELPLRLTRDPADDKWPAWSPDGRNIAFLRRLDSGCGIFTVPPLGGSERKLTELGWTGDKRVLSCGRLAWSPDGKLLAVSHRTSEQAPWQIFLISIGTLEAKAFTSPPQRTTGDLWLAFSPDSKSLAFSRVKEEGAASFMIQSISGGAPKLATSQPSREFMVSGLAWSPDGTSLLFTSQSRGTGEPYFSLWRITLPGGRYEQVMGVSDHVHMPATSLRGNRLALTRVTAGYLIGGGIWRIQGPKSKHPGGPPQPFISSSVTYNASPEYSPDGSRIVFLSNRATGVFGNIWVCNSDGSNPLRLTSLPGHSGTPRWSPDGKQIVFDSIVEGQVEVFVVDADGGLPRRLTHAPSFDGIASWSRDGQSIYFASNRTGLYQIWKMPARGGHATQVTRGGGYGAFESLDGATLYFSKWGGNWFTPGDGIWKMPVKGGAETRILDRIVNCFDWKVTKQGIYFLSFKDFRQGEFLAVPQPSSAQWSIELFNPKTGKATRIFSRKSNAIEGLAVSPDGQWILFQENPPAEADIMLAENFR
jgi:Tol biopolymer transport system component/DNA-binding winged helix-turn-helix (wHTH) protein